MIHLLRCCLLATQGLEIWIVQTQRRVLLFDKSVVLLPLSKLISGVIPELVTRMLQIVRHGKLRNQ